MNKSIRENISNVLNHASGDFTLSITETLDTQEVIFEFATAVIRDRHECSEETPILKDVLAAFHRRIESTPHYKEQITKLKKEIEDWKQLDEIREKQIKELEPYKIHHDLEMQLRHGYLTLDSKDKPQWISSKK